MANPINYNKWVCVVWIFLSCPVFVPIIPVFHANAPHLCFANVFSPVCSNSESIGNNGILSFIESKMVEANMSSLFRLM